MRSSKRSSSLGATSLVATLAVALQTATLGCAPYSYGRLRHDIDKMDRVLKATLPSGANTEDKVLLEMPRMKARYCLERAAESYAASKWSSGIDIGMLVAAGLTGGVGTSMGAAAAAMDDDTHKSRKDIGIASVTTIAAAGAILGLRAALNLSELGRTQRIAAARDVNAAISIIEKYALADDPKEVTDDGFTTCRDGEIDMANALPGAKAGELLEKTLTKAKEEKAETEKAASTAKSTEARAKTEAEANKSKVVELEKTVKARRAQARNEAAAAADPELQKAEKDLAAAKAEQAELDAKAKEAERKAKIEEARAQVAAAQVDVNEKRLGVVQSASQLRRAVFYLTARDVDLSLDLLKGSQQSLATSRSALAAAQKRLDQLLSPPPPAPPVTTSPPGTTTAPVTPPQTP